MRRGPIIRAWCTAKRHMVIRVRLPDQSHRLLADNARPGLKTTYVDLKDPRLQGRLLAGQWLRFPAVSAAALLYQGRAGAAQCSSIGGNPCALCGLAVPAESGFAPRQDSQEGLQRGCDHGPAAQSSPTAEDGVVCLYCVFPLVSGLHGVVKARLFAVQSAPAGGPSTSCRHIAAGCSESRRGCNPECTRRWIFSNMQVQAGGGKLCPAGVQSSRWIFHCMQNQVEDNSGEPSCEEGAVHGGPGFDCQGMYAHQWQFEQERDGAALIGSTSVNFLSLLSLQASTFDPNPISTPHKHH